MSEREGVKEEGVKGKPGWLNYFSFISDDDAQHSTSDYCMVLR